MTTMTLNTNLNGIELRFDEKPTDAIRESMKALGFRWSPKKSMWWAKQNPERLALANSIVEESPKPKTKKTAKKATAEQPKAEPKKDAEKPKALVTAKDLSDKTSYYVATAKGFETRKGYTFVAKVGKTKVQLGVAKEKDNTWTITELTTGIMVAGDIEKRYIALNMVTEELVKNVAALLKTDEYKKRVNALEKHTKKASK